MINEMKKQKAANAIINTINAVKSLEDGEEGALEA